MTQNSLHQVLPCDQGSNPQIYVACLSAYNNGHLHGQWIEVTDDVDEILDNIAAMLKRSPMLDADEWAIHADAGFGSFHLNEYTPIEDVMAYAEFIAEHGEEFGSGVLNYAHDLDDAKRFIEDAYHGEFKSEADFVEQMAQEVYTIPKELEFYIDYELMARDWFINGYFSIELGHQRVHVFSYL